MCIPPQCNPEQSPWGGTRLGRRPLRPFLRGQQEKKVLLEITPRLLKTLASVSVLSIVSKCRFLNLLAFQS
jgi:hypothetical protein